MKTTVAHVRGEQYDIYIGRRMFNRYPASIWGNPYPVSPRSGRGNTRYQAIYKYVDYLRSHEKMLELIPSLQGKVLGCWCHPKACHGDILAYLADNQDVMQRLRKGLLSTQELIALVGIKDQEQRSLFVEAHA